MWASYPTPLRVPAILINKFTANDINFFATGMYVSLKMFARWPMHERGRLALEIMKRHHFQVAVSHKPIRTVGVDIDMLMIFVLKLVQFDQ